MLVKLPTQTCKSQQVCWLNSHSLDCFRVWICLYFHPPELSLWSQWCSYVIGVSSSISHTYIEAGTPSNDLGMHLYYIYIFIKFLYTYLYWLVELPLFASEITRNHMFPGWLLGFPAKIPQSILLLRLLRSLKSRQNLPWSFSPRLFLCFFLVTCAVEPPHLWNKAAGAVPDGGFTVSRPGPPLWRTPLRPTASLRPVSSWTTRQIAAAAADCLSTLVGYGGLVSEWWFDMILTHNNGDLTWFNPHKWWFYMILTTKN